jgi:hypothetical protein
MKKYKALFFMLLPLLFVGCDDIFEEDISDDIISVITPIEDQEIQGNVVNFRWNSIDGVDDYRLQIYNQQQAIIVDSLIYPENQSFSMILSPGSYQWRVRGENFAYTTAYTFPVNFTVVSSEDLTNQAVILSSPSNSFYTNNDSTLFTWESLANAETYTFQLVRSLNGEETILEQTGISNTSLEVSQSLFVIDAKYIWKVKAVNETSETNFSERSVYFDRNVPNQPILNTPSNDQIISNTTVIFNWLNGVDSGNVQSDIENLIEISDSFNFTSIINSSTVLSNTYQYDLEVPGTYYWRVKASDIAGNESDYSTVRAFTID